jgi:type IV pilus assembly protein PilW
MKTLTMKKQNGLTLVEMMIAMTLSVILLAGLAQIFNSNKLSFQMTNGIARVQESGRISMEFLGREIRSAGFVGCSTGELGANFVNNVDETKYSDTILKKALALYNGNNSITGFNDVTTVSGTTLADFGISMGSSTGDLISDTDAVLFLGTKPCLGGNVVSHDQATGTLIIADAAACGLTDEDIVVVSNCNTADAFAIDGNPTVVAGQGHALMHTSGVNKTDKVSTFYDDTSFVYKMSSSLFYVGRGTSGEPALFMKTLTSAANATPFQVMELAEGIEDFQLLFGEDTGGNDNSVNRYVTSNLVSDMNDVKAIKVRLLVRSADRSSSDIEQKTSFEGATIVSTDDRYRKPYESTITIRNRVR